MIAGFACAGASVLAGARVGAQHEEPAPSHPLFYRDILPVLQEHCESCHRGEAIAGRVPLETYEEAKQHRDEIVRMVTSHDMPPWFADPRFGKFANDISLRADQIAMLQSWVKDGTPAGDPAEGPPPLHFFGGWNIPKPDQIIKMPVPVDIPASGIVDYTYEIVPTGFTEDKWAQFSQVLPSSPQFVHHAVIYIRPPGSTWLRGAPKNIPFTAKSMNDVELQHQARGTTSDMLLVYAPGSSPDRWPETMAKFIPAGADLVFQMHYTTDGKAGEDQTSVGVVFSKQPPEQRVITLQLNNYDFLIPPGADNFPVEVHGTMPNDCTLLSFFPHMHLRGKAFEYNIVHADKTRTTLLRVNYNFYWQLSYKLATPMPLKAGTELQAIAWFDNSPNNPHNPDPSKAVRWGDQTIDEMMVGFFDIAIPASMDKEHFFIRHPQQQ